MNSQNKKWEIYLVAHTHWDKEWYFTKQDSDILLFDNIEKLLEMLDKNEIDNFTYDGQVSVIDDYLNYSRKNINKLKKYLKEKKLIIGPWYTQPDFFNISSESIIRNLLYGINRCKELGANYLKVAYVPDSFGHNNQMPQIYNLFGLHNFLYWRGISKRVLTEKSIINNWVGINGDKILSYNLMFGYWPFGANYPYIDINLNNIKEKASIFLENIESMILKIKENTKDVTNKILIPLGGDQAPIMKHLKEFVSNLNSLSNDKWILSDYDSFFEKLREEIKVIQDNSEELKYPYLSRIHKTIGSQRQDIKYKMQYLETELYYNLEPLLSYWNLNNGKYETDFIKEVIKNMLISQAHDSIGGCNSDRTNDDVLNRIERSIDIVESLKTKILKSISKLINLTNNEFIIFNSELFQNIFTKKIKLFTKYEYFEILDNDNKNLIFEIIKSKYHSDGMNVRPSENGESLSKAEGFFEHDVLLKNFSLEALSYKKFNIEKLDKPKKIISNWKSDIKVKIDKEKIIIDCKEKNKKLELYFEAEYDSGDSYDYSPKQNEKILINNFISSKMQEIKFPSLNKYDLELNFEVPVSEFKNNKVEQKINVEILTYENSTFEFKVNTKNNSTEIRWRLIILSNFVSENYTSDQCYSVIERKNNPYLKNWQNEHWKEAPVNIESFESFVGIKNDYFLYTKGLKECEFIENNKLAITLYRTVSSLGRNNLIWRPGRASGTSEFNIKTEKTKMLNYVFENNFKIDFRNPINPVNESKNFIKEVLYYQIQKYNNLYKRFDRFLMNFENIKLSNKNKIELSNKNFIVKVFKKHEKTKDYIIRGFNPLNKNLDLQIKVNNRYINFDIANLKEEVIKSNINNVKVKKNEIVTLIIRREEINDR